MSMPLVFLILACVGYVCGSVPFAKMVGNLHGIDIQKHGSGNIGFANTVRVLGWKAGLLVLPGDVLKGAIPVLIAGRYLPLGQVFIVALAAILGHVFPVWLRFKGGKGIATGLGTTLVLNPVIGGIGIAVYIVAFVYFRSSAPSSIMAAWSLPLFCFAYYPGYAYYYLAVAIIIIWTHRKNIIVMMAKS